MGYVEDYVAGATAVAIARAAHVRVSTVSAVLREAGVLDQHGRSAVTRQGRRPHTWAASRWRGDLTEGETGYIAGLIDGEGSLTHQSAKYAGWRVDVSQLAATGLAQWLVERTGIGMVDARVFPGRSDMANWRVARSAEVRDLLVAVLPHLRVKRERALEVLQDIEPTRAQERA